MKKMKSPDIAAAVREAIKSGEFNGRMPTDLQLASRYGVNAKTIGLALCRLESEGLVSRKRRVGTWALRPVSPRRPSRSNTRTVILLIRTGDHLFGALSGLIVRQFQNLGWQTMVYDSDDITVDNLPALMDRIDDARPDAVVADILFPFPWDEFVKHLPDDARLLRIGNPVGVCERARHLFFDYFEGARSATKHLIKLGRRRILLIDALFEPPPQYYRKTCHYYYNMGYRKALDEGGLAGHERFFFNCNRDDGDDALRLRKIFEAPDRPDAVLAFGDFRAVQCMRVLAELRLSVPDDAAMVGTHDTPWCEATTPRLASVSVEPELVALTIAEAVTASEFPLEPIVTPTRMVPRESAPALVEEDGGGRERRKA